MPVAIVTRKTRFIDMRSQWNFSRGTAVKLNYSITDMRYISGTAVELQGLVV